jgi:hypothetical protein
MSGFTIQSRVTNTRQEPMGNCVKCRRRINFGQEYKRVPGVLGKVCVECAEES